MFNFINSGYYDYRISLLEDAEEILRNKKDYILDSSISTEEKLLKLQEISDFFYVEEEYDLSREFLSVYKAIQIKKILKI